MIDDCMSILDAVSLNVQMWKCKWDLRGLVWEDYCKWVMTFILGWTNLLKKSSWSALMLSGSLNYNISILIREACDISKHICTSVSRNWMIIQTLLIAPSFTEVKQETICCRDADNTLFTRHPSDFWFIRWILSLQSAQYCSFCVCSCR